MDWTRTPPLSQLRAFEAAARAGGLSAAARELNVTHAAVGQQIRKLEAALGARLAYRRGRGLALTEEGRRLGARLTDAFTMMAAAAEEVARRAEERPVRISLTPSFSAHWLGPRLSRFRAAHPEIELMLHPSAAVVDLVAGGFDLAIRFGAGAWPGLRAEPLLASPHVVAAAATLIAGKTLRHPRDLLELPWIQETGVDEWRVWLAEHGVAVPRKRDVLHMPGDMAVAAIRRGEGVGLTARALVAEDLAAGRLVALFDASEDGRTGYHIVWPEGPLRPPAAAVAAWLRAQGDGGAA